MARAGWEVTVHEAAETVGGGVRSEELTLPGFVHDVCSAIHPLGRESPFFRDLELPVDWVQPEAPGGAPAGRRNGGNHRTFAPRHGREARGGPRRLSPPLQPHRPALERLRAGRPRPVPASPEPSAVRGRPLGHPGGAFERDRSLAKRFQSDRGARSPGRPRRALDASARDAAQRRRRPLPDRNCPRLRLGLSPRRVAAARRRTRRPPRRARRRDPHREPGGRAASRGCGAGRRRAARAASHRRRQAARPLRPRAAPLPARAGGLQARLGARRPDPLDAPDCTRAATVHVGGTLEEIAESERAPREGRHAERPYVLLTQPSLFDDTRAPAGKHTAWAYCHVPNGSTEDMTERMEAQVERFAPGFRDLILARSSIGSADFERRQPQHRRRRHQRRRDGPPPALLPPVRKLVPYRTPSEGLYLCSSSTPPGGGVHGMCGQSAALVALRDHDGSLPHT